MLSLVVEDTPVLAKLLADILIRLGHRVLTAAELVSAMRAIEGGRPGLVIVDGYLLRTSGAAVRSAFLRAFSRLPAIVLAESSSGAEEEYARLRCGPTAVVHKPFDLSQLTDTVASMLRKPSGLAADVSQGTGTTVAGCWG
jgi:DNA-binding response OmpR family regulator